MALSMFSRFFSEFYCGFLLSQSIITVIRFSRGFPGLKIALSDPSPKRAAQIHFYFVSNIIKIEFFFQKIQKPITIIEHKKVAS